MNGTGKRSRQWIVPSVAILSLAVVLWASANASDTSSLNALERRALQAQALLDEVTHLNVQLQATTAQLSQTQDEVTLLNTRLDEQNAQIESLGKQLEESRREINKKDHLLSLLRSGAFEYYEVQTGDTLESIAANPMVYGNKDLAKWIQQVNGISPSAVLAAGTVLIIPRYTEGASYDF